LRADKTQELEKRMGHYEGLVRKTSSRYYSVLNYDFEDLCQVFRLKVFQALKAYDPKRSRMCEEKFVFGCLRNRVKDLLRQLRARVDAGWREPSFIEDVAPRRGHSPEEVRDAFEHHYMASTEEAVYADIYREIPTIPSTLNKQERRIVALLYVGFNQPEIAERLGVPRAEITRVVQGVRIKLADWNPGSQIPTPETELIPIPIAA
jgi:RNA polymerase sigma factor (sigma-70 family)